MFRKFVPILGVVLLASHASAQVAFTGNYSQNFDTLANSPSGSDVAFTNNVTLPGWYFATSSGSRNNVYRVGSGTDNQGSLYSFGTTGVAERALGSVGSNALGASGSGGLFYGVNLTNNTGGTITSFQVAYTGEQWRNGGNTASQMLAFAYSLNATNLTTGTYVNVSTLAFVSPVHTSTAGALNGNLSANQTPLSETISSLSLAPGASLWLRWFDLNDSGNDHGLAIDNLNVTASFTQTPTTTPEPGAVTLLATGMAVGGCMLRKRHRK